MCCAFVSDSADTAALRLRGPDERIAAVADPGSVSAVNAALAAPRPSPHLARWGIVPQENDGVVVARATIGGAPVLIAAQDERFLGGSAGVNHADALRHLFEHARAERPAAVILLAASGGVRLHEANPAELALAKALGALCDLRLAGVRVLAIGVANVFGGASVLACAADRTALLPGTRFGLSGPKVVETTCGRGELDADDAAAVNALFGAEARAAAGHLELVPDNAEAIREWVSLVAPQDASFVRAVEHMQTTLATRLVARRLGRPSAAVQTIVEAVGTPRTPLPRRLAPIYAGTDPVDRNGWLWRMPGGPIWLTRPSALATFGPADAHAQDAALLANLAGSDERERATLFVVGDSCGHEISRSAEALCISQYLAQHAAVLALLRSRGVRVIGLLTAVGHSAAFFVNALQASHVYALAGTRVVAMEPDAIARVTKQDKERLAALIENDPLLGQPVRHFASWGGITEILPELSHDRLVALAAREQGDAPS
jgi:malonate decarboxylase beta subunit